MSGKIIDTSREAAVRLGGEDYANGKWAELPVCRDCSRKLRPHGGKPAAWPATVSRAARGYCTQHYALRLRQNEFTAGRSERKREISRQTPSSGGYEHPMTDRQRAAAGWSEADRSVALLVCDHSADANEAVEVLEMLGLFDLNPVQYTTGFVSFSDLHKGP